MIKKAEMKFTALVAALNSVRALYQKNLNQLQSNANIGNPYDISSPFFNVWEEGRGSADKEIQQLKNRLEFIQSTKRTTKRNRNRSKNL